jgi:hypothetical protein
MLALLGRAVFSGGLALDLAAVIGLLGFLAWILSGILRPQIELEEAVRRVVRRYERWDSDNTLETARAFDRAVRAYIQAAENDDGGASLRHL